MASLEQIKVTEISEVITVLAPTGRRMKITNRPFFGLSFCKEGKITYTHNGKRFVSDKDCAIFCRRVRPMSCTIIQAERFRL